MKMTMMAVVLVALVGAVPAAAKDYCAVWRSIDDPKLKLATVQVNARQFAEGRFDLACMDRKAPLFVRWTNRLCGTSMEMRVEERDYALRFLQKAEEECP